MTFRWFGPDDPVRLEHIRQIPGVTGIVSALHEIMPGEPWPLESLERLGERIDTAGLDFAVVESIPVHEDIKLGRPSRDRLIENYCASVQRVGAVGISEVRMAMHPDDPPWPIFGLPRIITDKAALARLVGLVHNVANGITFCTGSLGCLPENDLPAMIRQFAGRIHFAHCRNVRITGARVFHETPHPSRFGHVDMLAVLLALRESGFDGPMRPDHGRMIWNETGRPGYGLHDRALGAMYLQGLWEGLGGVR